MDQQKKMVARYSSTASRLSQRLLCSIAVENEFDVEQWDIGNAFLKGFSFDKMREMCTKFGITIPDVERRVCIKVPGNVWHILRKLGFMTIDPAQAPGLYCLELLKAMYGLVDAPVLWSIALRYFVISDLGGKPSRYDDQFFYWINPSSKTNKVVAVCAIHVDDVVIAANKTWLKSTLNAFIGKFGNVKRQVMPFVNIGMEYSRTKNGGICLSQKDYAAGLNTVQLPTGKDNDPSASASSAGLSESEPLTAAQVTQLRAGIGAVLFLCLTRWDLLYDLCILQTRVKDAAVKDLKECNRIIYAAKRHSFRGLIFDPLTTVSHHSQRRLAAVADSSHASAKSSYAFEGNLVFLQEECHAQPQRTSQYEKTVAASSIPGLSGRVHPLYVRSQKAKRLSQSTSHAETLSQLSCTAMAECIAMRYTEMYLAWTKQGTDTRKSALSYGTPTLETLMDYDLDGRYEVPVDSWTDCLDLMELTTGLKGVPQDRHQRLAILALREKRVAGRIRLSYWMQTDWMIANALTKHDPNCPTMWELLTAGRWQIEGQVRVRKSIKVEDYDESDLRKMRPDEGHIKINEE